MSGRHANLGRFDRKPTNLSTELGERRSAIAAERHQKPSKVNKKRGVIDWVLVIVAEVLLTVFVLTSSFFLWKFFINDFFANSEQSQAANDLINEWTAGATVGSIDYDPDNPPVAGEPRVGTEFAVIHIPRLGTAKPIVQGTSLNVLARGAGHYVGSAMPGGYGNFAVAGHRSSVFYNLKSVVPGDRIYIQTSDGYYTYEVVNPHYIVKPNATQVISPIPGDRASTVSDARAENRRTLTLTTCWPEWSNRERLILHAEFVEWRPAEAGPPAEIR